MASKLTSKELRSQVEALIKNNEPQLMALSTEFEFEGDTLEAGNQTFSVRRARTVLEFYDLVDRASGRPLLCLTQLSDSDIGLDLRSRLYKRRILGSDPWQTVKHMFDCRSLESSLVEQHHLARYLSKFRPVEGYGKVKGDVLTAAKVWSCLFAQRLKLPADYLDNLSLLQWASGDCSAYLSAPTDLKESAAERVKQVCGDYGRFLLATVEDGTLQPLALGLALRCLVEESPQQEHRQREARVRLERYVGGELIDVAVAKEWAGAAEHLLLSGAPEFKGLEAEADKVLEVLVAKPLAYLSDYLPSGLEGRKEVLAGALSGALETGEQDVLEEACRQCLTHRGVGEREKQAIQMLPRLLRWVESDQTEKKRSLADLSCRYAWNTSFADWARLRCEGHMSGALALPFSRLLERVVARSEKEAEEFAHCLKAWNSAGEPKGPGLAGVEDLLSSVLSPILSSKGQRFLLVVLDGCAWPTLHELMETLVETNWKRMEPISGLPALLATYPSVTEYSRASLLSGMLTGGSASTEKTSFSEYPALREGCDSKRPPLLFHKGDLSDGQRNLSLEVESKVSDARFKAVGVVLNAIDDHLDKNDQLENIWRVENISYLADLIALAHRAGRVLVLASDHGHILERNSELRKAGEETGGARWKRAGEVRRDEIELSGPRALGNNNGNVVLPWTEKVRYTNKKNGYHGGCHPRELLAPLLVLAPADRELSGWREVSHTKPTWWDAPVSAPTVATASPPPAVFLEQEDLATESGQFLLTETAVPKTFADIIVSFPTIEERWKDKGLAVSRDWAHKLITLLEESGDSAPITMLASRLKLSDDRFRELFIKAAGILSVDGRYLVSLTPDAQAVRLDRKALGDFSEPSESGSLIEVERVSGDTLRFRVPLKTLDTKERLLLETLARHDRVSESEIKKTLRTRRSGFVERLMEKLAKHGFHALKQAGEDDGGRIYRLETGGLS